VRLIRVQTNAFTTFFIVTVFAFHIDASLVPFLLFTLVTGWRRPRGWLTFFAPIAGAAAASEAARRVD
jgi:hypothetical protein